MNTLTNTVTSCQENFNSAKEYIELLTGNSNTKLTFACYHDKKNPSYKPKHFYGTLEQHYDALKDLNDKGYGIFATIQETSSVSRKSQDIGKIRSLFTDCDYKGIPEQHLEPSFIVETSDWKHHLYWVLDEPQKLSEDEFKSYIIPLIKHYKSDETCKDLARVLRLPGFYHHKGEPFLVRIAQSSGKKYSLSEIIEGLEITPKIADIPAPKDNKISLSIAPQVDDAYLTRLDEEFDKLCKDIKALKPGKRHNTINEKCYTFAGYCHFSDKLLADYCEKIHTLVDGLWEVSPHSHTMIDEAFEDGSKKPLWLKLEEKLSKSNQYKKALKLWLEDFGELEWNEMRLCLEIDREEADSAYLRQRFQEDMNKDIPKETFNDIIVHLAKENSYHPFKEYLDNLPEYQGDAATTWSKLCQCYGLDDQTPYIQIEQMKKHLISGVARTYDPGCKMDNVLLLKGGQGYRKTSSFAALYGSKNFQTLGAHGKESDELLSMYRSVCIEYGEIEATFDKKGLAALKGFLTKTTDTFRAPYAVAPLTIKRNFVLVGTTNEEEFLADKTGNRRYWVVDIKKKIDIKGIEANRDEFWALAKSLYFAGILGYEKDGSPIYVDNLWWFSDEEEEEVAKNTSQSEQIDDWEDCIISFMKTRKYALLKDIKEHLNVPNSSTAIDRRITSILRKIGAVYHKNKISIVPGGERARYWEYEKAIVIEEDSF